jgi:NitT/TauT family transport system ATP-binding protein
MFEIDIQAKGFVATDGGPLQAIENLQLKIAPSEFVCLVGPSGCGKTTTLRILLGLDTDFTGSVSGITPDSAAGVVFQEPRLLPWRTVEQNVRLALKPAQREGNLDALFETLGLAELRSFFPGELSLGLARRAALARALAFDPSLLVLDEPFVSLDDATAVRLRELLMTIWHERQCAVLMVSHNLNEAVRLADRLVVLSARPAAVVGEVALTTDRSERDQGWIEQQIETVNQLVQVD